MQSRTPGPVSLPTLRPFRAPRYRGSDDGRGGFRTCDLSRVKGGAESGAGPLDRTADAGRGAIKRGRKVRDPARSGAFAGTRCPFEAVVVDRTATARRKQQSSARPVARPPRLVKRMECHEGGPPSRLSVGLYSSRPAVADVCA